MHKLQFVLCIVLCTLFISCASSGAVRVRTAADLQAVSEKYKEEFNKIHQEMSIQELKELLPQIRLIGRSTNSETWQLVDVQDYYTDADLWAAIDGDGLIKTKEYIQKVDFYFSNGKLISWGPGQ